MLGLKPMKRFGHLVLLALVLQLTGVAGVCAPAQPTAGHDCCTPSEQRAPAKNTPECCYVSAFREQGSVGQTKSESENLVPDLALAERLPAPSAIAPEHNFLPIGQVTHPVSPPITPLQQTCLLLI